MSALPNMPQGAHSEYVSGWLASDSAKKDRIAVQRIYIDINDGMLSDGIIFSQIMYWHTPKKDGSSRLKVFRDGYFWLAKEYSDWWKECRIDERTARDCLERIASRNLIVKTTYKYNNRLTVHVRINWPIFEQLAKSNNALTLAQRKEAKRSAKRQKTSRTITPLNDRKRQGLMTENVSPITDTTTETTLSATHEANASTGGGETNQLTPQKNDPSKTFDFEAEFLAGDVINTLKNIPPSKTGLSLLTDFLAVCRMAKQLPVHDNYPSVVIEMRKIDAGNYGPSDAARMIREWQQQITPSQYPEVKAEPITAAVAQSTTVIESTHKVAQPVDIQTILDKLPASHRVFVRNLHKIPGGLNPETDIYIGRANKAHNLPASKWANPFVMNRESEREVVLAKYRQHLLNSPDLLRSLPELHSKNLICWCAPKACHGDILAEFCKYEQSHIDHLISEAEQRIAAEKEKQQPKQHSRAKPLAYSSQKVFDTLAEVIFDATDPVDVSAVAGRVGPLRKKLIAHVLQKRNVPDLDETIIEELCKHIRAFGVWYDEECEGCDKPKGVHTFMDNWIKYTKSGGKTAAQPVMNSSGVDTSEWKTVEVLNDWGVWGKRNVHISLLPTLQWREVTQ